MSGGLFIEAPSTRGAPRSSWWSWLTDRGMAAGGHDIQDGHVGPYRLGAEIGHGSFGRVFLGTHVGTGELVAVKVEDAGLNVLEHEVSASP